MSKYVQEAGYLESAAAAVRRADAGLKHGVRSLLKVDTRRYWDKKKFDAMMMKDTRGGNQLTGDICHNHPEYRSHLEKSVEALGEAVRDAKSPAYLLFDSETENEERKLYQCFHPACLELAKQAGFGQPPAHVNCTWGMVGVSLGAQAKQAKEGVLPASTPELDYIRWWWLHGSGYVDSRALAAERLKRYLPKARAFHDPILRNPAFLGRDRGMDFVSHWTYTNPSPLGLLENIDEMRAAVDGRKPVVPNIQLFWYTNEVVGKLENAADRAKAAREADSFVEARDAVHFGRFVTISPDHVREAVWLAMSRPVDAIMLDGGSSISTTPGTYANTNPDTAEALAAVSDTLVKPYGPMLKAMNRGPGRWRCCSRRQVRSTAHRQLRELQQALRGCVQQHPLRAAPAGYPVRRIRRAVGALRRTDRAGHPLPDRERPGRGGEIRGRQGKACDRRPDLRAERAVRDQDDVPRHRKTERGGAAEKLDRLRQEAEGTVACEGVPLSGLLCRRKT